MTKSHAVKVNLQFQWLWVISKFFSILKNSILHCFHVVSGLIVNFNKSKVFEIWNRYEGGCKLGWASWLCTPLPPLYLSWSPSRSKHEVEETLKLVIDRFQKKLSKWKFKTLSFGGRLTLIHSVLGNLPTYYLYLFVAPECVIETLEKMRNGFL